MQRCLWQGMPSGRVWRTPIKGTSPSIRDPIIMLNITIQSSLLSWRSKVAACLCILSRNSKSLKCGRLEYGFLRVRYESCHHERLAALVPPPRINLTRYYGVFAPNSQHRALVTPSRRGKGNKRHHANGADDHTPIEHSAAMSRAQ